MVSHVVNLVLTGKLRSGDRLDRHEIAHELGLSRVPVQEAVIQLEHDGILSTRYHRGAFVERFDESAVREHHELYGLLSGTASARAAAATDPLIVSELDSVLTLMRNGKDSRVFDAQARRFRAVVNAEYAGPRLQAAIDSSQTLIPRPSGPATANTTTRCCPPTKTNWPRSARPSRNRRGRRACIAPR